MRIGFIGVGNMGSAMLKGALNVMGIDNLSFTDANAEQMNKIAKETSIKALKTNKEVVEQNDVVVLAVKPQYIETVLNEIVDVVNEEKIIISIAPGITIDGLKKHLGDKIRIVRSMPNTPALVLEGMSAYAFSKDYYSQEDQVVIKDFFESFGKAVELSEHQLDMVVPVSGSSPAYAFVMIEAMADAAVLTGLPRALSYQLAAQTMLGAAKMVLETGEHPAVLKDAVCSPGGTTIEAVRVLEQKGFRSSIIEAMEVCYKKAKAFS